jgi:hypothetical protein
VAVAVVTLPLALWLVTEPLVAVMLLAVAVAALTTRRLARPFASRLEPGPPAPTVVAPRDH